MDHPIKKRGPCHPHLYLYQLSHLYLELIWIDDLRAPSTRKLLALLDIAAAVSANSRVFASQALPTWLGNLITIGWRGRTGSFLFWDPWMNTHIYRNCGCWGGWQANCHCLPCLGMSTPGLPSFFLRFPRGSFDRRAKNYFQQMSMGHRDLDPKSLRPNHGREIEKIQSS